MTAASKGSGTSIMDLAARQGLEASLLYAAVMDLASEGLLTARCVNAAAGLLLADLGLPPYYFRTLTKDALVAALRVIAKNLDWDDSGRCVLNEALASFEVGSERGVQILLSCESTLARLEAVAGEAMMQHRWEYYFAPHTRYTTYIIKPEICPSTDEIAAGASPFAFAYQGRKAGFSVQHETEGRYRSFLSRHEESVSRLIEFSVSGKTGETRIMFHKNIAYKYLPIIRKILASRGLRLNRAYGEPYRTANGTIASVCSLYVAEGIDRRLRKEVAADLRAFLALGENPFAEAFLSDAMSFSEMIFGVNLAFFIHHFIYRDLKTDRLIMDSLRERELRGAMAKRINDANRSEYTRRIIHETLNGNPDLVRMLFTLFDMTFNPARAPGVDAAEKEALQERFEHDIERRFVNDESGLEIMRFALRFITGVLRTNFYMGRKRSYAFRLDDTVLDPVVFPDGVYGLYFVHGHYATGTHMRAADIARGGLRLLRVTEATYENALDDANLLNYDLGPKAQRLKHKDIAESGSKGVIIPTPSHARDALQAIYDYGDGILDLMLPSPEVVDLKGPPEMLFFGPDEGTAPLMDALAARAKERGYPFWRTLTTGKSIGIPHDAYGLLQDGRVFGLIDRQTKGTEVRIESEVVATTGDAAAIRHHLAGGIEWSGMTTTGIMAVFRTLIEHLGLVEKNQNLMMTGGPDGDLGANQIQCWQGNICLIIDGGGVVFDPAGLDRDTLLEMAVARHSQPRPTSADFPVEKLGPGGFRVTRTDRDVVLPDGTVVEDGAFFHSHFLFRPASRHLVEAANIQTFIPCGGLRETINIDNVDDFLHVFPDLRIIVEGANVFFDDVARDTIAATGRILQIKDSTANKGGVTCSSLSEILPAFLLGDEYESCLVTNGENKIRLVHELLGIIQNNAVAETRMLLALHARNPSTPLYRLSIETSERLLSFQQDLYAVLDDILAKGELVRAVVLAYTPRILHGLLGEDTILERLDTKELRAYRDAIVTKKLAALALYRHATEWEEFLARFAGDPLTELTRLAGLS